MRELGIYLDLIACNFVLLIKLLPDRNRATFTVAIGGLATDRRFLGRPFRFFDALSTTDRQNAVRQ